MKLNLHECTIIYFNQLDGVYLFVKLIHTDLLIFNQKLLLLSSWHLLMLKNYRKNYF